MTAMDFRQYDQALGRFYGMDLLAEASVYSTPYHYGYNNPVYWSDSSGLLSDSFIGSIWNNSPDKSRTYWENMGGYFVSNHVNAFGNSIATLYDGTIGETLPMMYVDATKGGGGALNYSSEGGFDIGKRIQDHTYRYGKSYQGYRDGLRSAQWDRFQGGLDYAGAIPVLGEPIDMINAAISALRGNYGAAALSAAAMIPIGGNVITGGKYLNKISKYEKFADSFGTRAYIKEFNNTTAINTRILFNDITQGGTKSIIKTPQGNIIRSTMSDGNIIQLRNFSTKSGSINHSTIQFIGSQNKWKFNY